MCRKFKGSYKVWMKYAGFQASSMNDMGLARGTLKRSLQVLPKQKREFIYLFIFVIIITFIYLSFILY